MRTWQGFYSGYKFIRYALFLYFFFFRSFLIYFQKRILIHSCYIAMSSSLSLFHSLPFSSFYSYSLNFVLGNVEEPMYQRQGEVQIALLLVRYSTISVIISCVVSWTDLSYHIVLYHINFLLIDFCVIDLFHYQSIISACSFSLYVCVCV